MLTLKIVPVCGGGSDDLMSSGSICGRAGRRLRRIIFLVFFPPSSVVDTVEVLFVVVRALGVSSGWCSGAASDGRRADSTSAILNLFYVPTAVT